jgi:hypothetical protein
VNHDEVVAVLGRAPKSFERLSDVHGPVFASRDPFLSADAHLSERCDRRTLAPSCFPCNWAAHCVRLTAASGSSQCPLSGHSARPNI